MNSRRISALSALRPALVLLLLMTVLTGFLYPLLVTGLAQLLFPKQAAGSIITRDGHAVGSRLIGQSFSDPRYFWSRPSATTPQPYNGTASSGSNQGPLNPALLDAVKARVTALRAADPADSGRPGHRLRQRARSGDQRGGRQLPGGAHRARAWPRTRARAGIDCAAHGG
jgi:K+-transporting ATPase KdpC subunit